MEQKPAVPSYTPEMIHGHFPLAREEVTSAMHAMRLFAFDLFFPLLLEREMAAPSSILARRIPWTEEPGGLQSMELQRVRHD